MTVDEAVIPGGTLVNATVTFIGDPSNPSSLPTGLIDWNFSLGNPDFPFPATAGARITFRTNASREIVAWEGSFLDGPPDGSISSSILGDSFFDPTGPGNVYLSAGIGEWSVVPLPGALPLLLTALSVLGLLGWRKKRLATVAA